MEMSEKSKCVFSEKSGEGDEQQHDELNMADTLDLAELEAMLAIDNEQVRYDQQTKEDLDVENPHSSYSDVISSSSCSRKQWKLRGAKGRTPKASKKTVAVSLFSSDIEELEHADATVYGGSTASSSKDIDDIQSQISMDSSASATPSLSVGDESSDVFAKPTPPGSVKHKNPRVYSYSPISRTRLTVPKRHFSPEPARKTAKILVGPRRVTETIRLSDLSEILRRMEPEEFSLPPDFTLKFKKRFVCEIKAETVTLENLQGNSEDGNADGAGLQRLSSDSDMQKETKNEILLVPEVAVRSETAPVAVQKEEEKEVLKIPEEPKIQRRRRGRPKLASRAEIPVVQRDAKEESPTPLNISISKTSRGRPRKRTALIKLKRGKPRKSFAFDTTANENVEKLTSPNTLSVPLSAPETSLKDTHGEGESRPSVSLPIACTTSASHSTSFADERGNEADDEYEESKIEVLDSGMSGMFDDTVEDRCQSGDVKKMGDIFGAIRDDDYDDGERLHIVDDEEDSRDTDIRSSFQADEKRDPKDVVEAVIRQLLDDVCGAPSPGVSLITEPLRRPATFAMERRRVPPLRIRLPRRREPRQRRPARARDYSPPLPVSRQQRFEEMAKRRASATGAEADGGGAAATDARQKRQARSKESQKKSSYNSAGAATANASSSPTIHRSPMLFGASIDRSIPKSTNYDISQRGFSGLGENAVPGSNFPMSSSRESSQVVGQQISLDASAGTGQQETEPAGRLRRKKPISLKQLYPSLFSRRRKSSAARTSAELPQFVSEQNAGLCSSFELGSVVQSKSWASTESSLRDDGNEAAMPAKQRRRRGQRLAPDANTTGDMGQRATVDADIYGFDDGKDQIISPHTSGGIGLTDNEGRSYDGATAKRVSTDLALGAEAESVGSAGDDVRRRRKRGRRRLSSTSTRDDEAAQSKLEAMEQDVSIGGSTSCGGTARRRRVRLDSEDIATNDSSVNLVHSVQVAKVPRRKSSTSVADAEVAKPDVTEVSASSVRSRGKRTDSKSVSEVSKPKVVRRSMPYFKRIAQRRKLNPLAIGLKSRSNDDSLSFFYREILLRGDDMKKEDGGDVVVDVDSELATEGDDETPGDSLASTVALELNKMLPRPETVNDGDTADAKVEEEDGRLLTMDNIRTMFTTEVPDRRRLLSDMMSVISAQYCSEVASQNILGGASIQYNTMVKNAHRMRDKMMLFTKDQRENAKWAHHILLERLAVPMLTTYINLLRYCKTTGRHMLDLLLEQSSDDKVSNKMNAYIRDFISEKLYDPQTTAIMKTLNKRHVKNICLITVSPNFTHAEYHSRAKSHEYMFRVLLPNVADRVEAVRLNLPVSQDLSVCEAVDHCIRLVSRKVVEVHRKYPDLKIVLVGWGTSCVINHQVVQSMPNVSAIINFAFPMKTAEGPRGDVDDDILLTYCPTLFVVGDQATDCDIHELQIMATRMIAPTGVIVVGSANCNLHPSTLRLTIERFTNRTVQRALLDDVVDFLELYCSPATSHSFRLHPLKLMEVNDVDLSILRTSNLFSGSQVKPSKSGSASKAIEKRRATDNSPLNPPVKKRRSTDISTPAESTSRKSDIGNSPCLASETVRSMPSRYGSTLKSPGVAPTFTGKCDVPMTQKPTNNPASTTDLSDNPNTTPFVKFF